MTYKELKIYTDGGARGNPGPAAAGVVITTLSGDPVERFGRYLGDQLTNNQAEYWALKIALGEVLKYSPQQLTCHLDSELVVNQLNGRYRVKNQELKPLYLEIQTLITGLSVSFVHIPRRFNQEADRLVNEALDRSQV